MMGARCTWIFLFYLICVTDSINVSSDVVDIGVFCCLFVVCIYICSAGYVELPIVLLYLLRCLVYHMLSKTRRDYKFTQSDSVYICSRVMPFYFIEFEKRQL